VVDGEQGGVSKAAGWNGGGGFRFYDLAPTLVVKDQNGLEIISEKYGPDMLAAAVCKLCGYRYAPREGNPFIHGESGSEGFMFVTTQFVTPAFLAEIAKRLKDGQKLVVCAPAFQPGAGAGLPNVRLRKIPQAVLSRCEYGADNYNLNIVELPEFDETGDDFEYVE